MRANDHHLEQGSAVGDGVAEEALQVPGVDRLRLHPGQQAGQVWREGLALIRLVTARRRRRP